MSLQKICLVFVWLVVGFFPNLLLAETKTALPIQTIITPSGFKAWLVSRPQSPTIAVQLAWRGGVEQDPPELMGLSQLMMTMLGEGTTTQDAPTFQQALADRNVSLSLSATRDALVGSLYLLPSDLAFAGEMLKSALFSPRLDAADLARVKAQQLAAIKQQQGSPGWQARYALMQALLADHPYGQRSLGSPSTLAAITREQILAELPRRLARDNLVITLVGNLDAATATAWLDKVLSNLPATSQLRPVADVVVPQNASNWVVSHTGTQSSWLWAWPGVPETSPDWAAAQVLNYVLGGGGFNSRLMQQIREKQGLTYGISTGISAMDHAALWQGQADVESAKAGQAVAALQQVVHEVQQTPLSDNELSGAKTYLTNALTLELFSTDDTAALLQNWQLARRPPDYWQLRGQQIAAVTAADVQRVAQQYLGPARQVNIWVGTPQGVEAAARPWLRED